MDPEEALGGDELEGFVERHDLAAEGARVAPSLAAPPEDLNLVALTGWAQPGDGSAGAQAVEGVALVGAHHFDAAPTGRPGVGLDPDVQVIGAAGHEPYSGFRPRVALRRSRAEAVCHDTERGSRGAGRLDAALPMPLHRRGLASRARAGLRCPAGAGPADRCRCPAGHGSRRGGRLCRLPSRAEPRALVLVGAGAPAPAAAGRRLRAAWPGGGRYRRHDRAPPRRMHRRERDLSGSGPLQPGALRQGQRPALALGHAAGARALGWLRLGLALPNRAGTLRALRHWTSPWGWRVC